MCNIRWCHTHLHIYTIKLYIYIYFVFDKYNYFDSYRQLFFTQKICLLLWMSRTEVIAQGSAIILFYWPYITLVSTLIFVFGSREFRQFISGVSPVIRHFSILTSVGGGGGSHVWHQHRCFFGAVHIQGQRCITCNRYRMLVSPAVILRRASQTKNKSTSGWPVTSGPTNIPVPNVHISPRGTANLQAGPSAIRFT